MPANRSLLSALAVFVAALLLVTSASAQSLAPAAPGFALPDLPPGLCAPQWEPTFGSEPGVGHPAYTPPYVACAAVFDDGLGDGPVLYVGGRFESAGGFDQGYVARWDGSDWSTPADTPNFTVYAMAVHDDGGGAALFVGGQFSSVGALDAENIARFDGTSWSALGSGTNGPVFALERHLVGPSTYHLAIGGTFTTADGNPAANIASWDGSTCTQLGDGLNGSVAALTRHPTVGPLQRLHAGGGFTASGAAPMSRLARLEGTGWVEVDGGVLGTVQALHSDFWLGQYTLFVGGIISSVGGASLPVTDFATWTDSGGWAAPPPFVGSGQVFSIAVYDDGGGPRLYVGGNFIDVGAGYDNCASFDGVSWSSMGLGISGSVTGMLVHDDGSGSSLWTVGQFYAAGGKACKAVARWDGSDWWPTGTGISGLRINTLLESSFDGTPRLYMGGYFQAPTLVGASNLAGWSDGSWVGMGQIEGEVFDIVEFDDGSGPSLFVGGFLLIIDGVPYDNIARWDGAAWHSVGGGTDGQVKALGVFDEGSGPVLFVGGNFDTAGGVPAEGLARWDGSSWSQVGAGMGSFGWPEAFQVWDDGSGEALYAGGPFSVANGGPADGIAAWDGSSWSTLGAGVSSGDVRCLEVWDDGSGEKLYAGGSFNAADGVPGTKEIAAWDGAAWSPLGVGMSNWVADLAVFDDGDGLALFAGGAFSGTADFGVPLWFAGRWDGSSWSALGDGLNDQVIALERFDDGSGAGPRLAVGGSFSAVHDLELAGGASTAATWGGCWDGENAWIDIGFALPGASGPPLLVGTGSLAYGSINTVDLSNAAPLALAGLFLGFDFMPTPFAGGILVPVPYLTLTFVTTSAAGTVPISFVMETPAPPGVALHVQWVITDVGAVLGYAISNCVVGTTP